MLIQWFVCSRCGQRRTWGATNTRCEEDVRPNPLLTCLQCSPKAHVVHKFDGFAMTVWGDYSAEVV